MTAAVKKEPVLRFMEFGGEWESSNLGKVSTFFKGKGISKKDIDEDGVFECVRYGQLYTDYGEVITDIISRTNIPKSGLVFSKANDVLIPSSGETQLDIATAACIVKSDIALGGDLNIIRSTEDGKFLAYYLSNKKKTEIAKLAQGNSVVHLYNNQLKTISLNIPTLPEQQKIANFLTAVDTKLEQLASKKTLLEIYKKGVMQQIFSQELRFTKEDGSSYSDWEEMKLGELGSTLNGLTGKTKDDFGSGKPYIQYKQIFDDTKINIENCEFVSIGTKDKQTKVKYGDVFFTTSSETAKEIATASVLLDEVDEMYLNSFCFGFRADKSILNPHFSRFLFHSQIFRKSIIPLAQGSTRYNISKVSFLKLTVKIPTIEEQTQIANFLSALDAKIALVDTQIDGTMNFKKGLLQQMFV